MRAMVQLPAYLERVLAGGRDLALVLLPLLNDMRAVRGSALLSEGTLLLLNLRSDEPARPASVHAGDREIADLARRLRPRFQLGLIGWIRGERVEQNLEQLADDRQPLRAVASSTQPLFQLWWVVGAVIEALRERGLRGQRVDQAPARPRRSRAAPPVGAGRAALCARAAGRTAEQPAVLRGAREVRRPAHRRRARARSASTTCCRSTRGSSRSARTCPRRASS